MSYILDALKKLENEKERKARGTGMINIAGELFKSGPTSPKDRRNWPIILVLALLASLITFGATFLLLHGDKVKNGKRHDGAPHVAPPSLATLPTPSPSSPPLPAKPTVPGPPVAVAPQKAAPPPAKARTTFKAPHPLRHPLLAKPAQQSVAPATEERAPAEPVRPAATSLVAAPADIKVSGIAWQDHRSASRVVVNGFLLREGNTVSGARIVEIFQNRVRFSSDAGTFEVYLVATGLPAPSK